MKTIIWIIGVFAAGVALVILLSRGASGLNPPLEVDKIHPLDYVKGNASSTVLLIEYSDFQCPACRSYYTMMRQVAQEYGDRLAIVYRHFPLITIHSNAEFAAMASEAARKQGKFWEMHDMLFEKQNEWSESSDYMSHFESYATLIGISAEQFKADFNSDDVKNFVRAERNHSIKIGLQGTPTFFLNGEQIGNPRTLGEFRSILNAALE